MIGDPSILRGRALIQVRHRARLMFDIPPCEDVPFDSLVAAAQSFTWDELMKCQNVGTVTALSILYCAEKWRNK